MIIIPNLQVRSSAIIEYNSYEHDGFRKRWRQDEFTKNLLQQKTYTGKLCPGAYRRLIKSVELLVQSAEQKTEYYKKKNSFYKFKLAFITLTIYSTDRTIPASESTKTCLEPFLRYIRDRYNVSYVWKAELQQRGQVHYHVTVDQFIPWKEIRNKWNELQKRAGYLDSHKKKFGTYHPKGSTHVKPVRNHQAMGNYLAKKVDSAITEFAKLNQNEGSVNGKVWDCSLNLKNQKYYTTVLDWSYTQKLRRLEKDQKVLKLNKESCTIYKFIGDFEPAQVLSKNDKVEYYDHMARIRTGIIRKKPDFLSQVEKPAKKVDKVPIQLNIWSTS